jgi:hypothetical protein
MRKRLKAQGGLGWGLGLVRDRDLGFLLGIIPQLSEYCRAQQQGSILST